MNIGDSMASIIQIEEVPTITFEPGDFVSKPDSDSTSCCIVDDGSRRILVENIKFNDYKRNPIVFILAVSMAGDYEIRSMLRHAYLKFGTLRVPGRIMTYGDWEFLQEDFAFYRPCPPAARIIEFAEMKKANREEDVR